MKYQRQGPPKWRRHNAEDLDFNIVTVSEF